MDIQQHERIAQIKTLSRHLYRALTGIHYVIWAILLVAILWIWLGTAGVITLVDHSVSHENLSIAQRSLLTAIISLFLALLLRVNYHVRQLVLRFADGDIFNKKATSHARKALHYAIAIYGVYAFSSLASLVYMSLNTQSFNVPFNGNYIFGLIIFCLMYILLWALEIGCDLNEESELTI